MNLPRLITTRHSHFCDKARWALDYHRIQYKEEQHIPIFSWLSTFTVGAKRTVPVLVAGNLVLPDSTDIVRWADANGRSDAPLLPDSPKEVGELEDLFDEKLGPATRRIALFHTVDGPRAVEMLLRADLPGWERALLKPSYPVLRIMMKKALKLDRAGADRSRAVVDRVYADVEERIKDGRKYLAGDRLSAADVAFASLSAPILYPPSFQKVSVGDDELAPELRTLVDGYRRTKPGAFAMRLYEEDRPNPG